MRWLDGIRLNRHEFAQLVESVDAETLVRRVDYTLAILLKGLKHLWVLVHAGEMS